MDSIFFVSLAFFVYTLLNDINPAMTKPKENSRPSVTPNWLNRKALPGKEWYWLAGLFAFAFIVRLIYIIQISSAPYFTNPIGDVKVSTPVTQFY